MKSFNNVVKTTFSIIGTIIGAGFISGREIISFFYGSDILVSSLILFFLFLFVFLLFLSLKKTPNVKLLKFFEPLLLIGNLILMSAMAAAADEIAMSIFNIPKILPIFSIGLLFFSYAVLIRGLEAMKSVNTILVPIIVVFVLLTLFTRSSPEYISIPSVNTLSLISYVGMNTFMSSIVFVNLGKDLNARESVFTAFFSSLILCGLIFYIYCALIGEGTKIYDAPVPMLIFLSTNITLKIIFSVVMLFAIATTLLSSHYPLYHKLIKVKRNKTANAVIVVVAFAVSRFGFYNIINHIYPPLGLLGAIYILLISILLIISQGKRRQDTSPKQVHTK